MSWFQYAACQSEDPELFFPIGTTRSALRQVQAAKRVCSGCVVRNACLEWAVQTGIDHGVWGGAAEEERRSLKRRIRRQRNAAATPRS